MGAYFLFFFIIFCFWLRYEIRKNSESSHKSINDFWENESKANSVRRKPINNLDYITFSKKSLPFIQINDEILLECEKELDSISSKRILKLTGLSNTELKNTYGAANLNALSEYDENFTTLCRLLSKYSSRLLELGYKTEAVSVMELSVNLGSDVSSVYKTLAKIYSEDMCYEKLDNLKNRLNELSPLLQKSLIKYMNEL